jgi:hypothetical protein
VTSEEPQGWFEDPFRLHDARYFSAGRPTKLVRDGDIESYDEPPDGDIPAPVSETALDQVASEVAPETESAGTELGDDWRPPTGPRRSRVGLLTTATVIAVAGIVTAVVVASKPAPSTISMSPTAFVTQSAQHTLSARSADVTLSGSLSALGESIPVRGTGQVDFTSNAMTLDWTMSASGHSMMEKEIQVGGNLYLAFSAGGQAEGKWVKTPVESGAASLGSTDPAASLAVLTQHGNTVRALGTQLIDGVTCTGYSVIPSKEAMIAAAEKAAGKLGAKNASISSMIQSIGSMMQPTFTVWFDANGLLREMSMRLGMQMQMGNSNDSFGAEVTLNFTNYGTPVRISAPPSSDTMSESSILNGLGSSGS